MADGDRAALGEVFERYHRFAVKLLRERGHGGADLDDLIQEAFLSLPTAARKCSPAASLGGCVATAVLYTVRAFYSRACNSDPGHTRPGLPARRVQLPPAEWAELRSADFGPDEVLEVRETVHHYSGLLLRLKPRDREAILAREFGAGRVDKSTLHRARRRLEQLDRAA